MRRYIYIIANNLLRPVPQLSPRLITNAENEAEGSRFGRLLHSLCPCKRSVHNPSFKGPSIAAEEQKLRTGRPCGGRVTGGTFADASCLLARCFHPHRVVQKPFRWIFAQTFNINCSVASKAHKSMMRDFYIYRTRQMSLTTIDSDSNIIHLSKLGHFPTMTRQGNSGRFWIMKTNAYLFSLIVRIIALWILENYEFPQHKGIHFGHSVPTVLWRLGCSGWRSPNFPGIDSGVEQPSRVPPPRLARPEADTPLEGSQRHPQGNYDVKFSAGLCSSLATCQTTLSRVSGTLSGMSIAPFCEKQVENKSIVCSRAD